MRQSRDVSIKLLPLHSGQKAIYAARGPRTVIRCGRRYGKTTMFEQMACNWSMHGKRVGFFAPDYKRLKEVYQNVHHTLQPAIKTSSKNDGSIDLKTGGLIDFWTLNDPTAGRSRKYHEVIIDEASLATGLQDIFEQSIAPTLLDFDGNATMGGTPLGIDEESYFYQACTNKEQSDDWPMVWKEFHAPTADNPMLPPSAIARLKANNAPLVYAQEYEALFVSWAGQSLLSLDSLTIEAPGGGRAGVPMPTHIDAVFAVVDSAIKDGKEHDGTAVTYFARSKYVNHPLIILDWDLIQVKGNLLEHWIPNVFKQCEYYAKLCKAKGGTATFIEDKASGSMLLQTAETRGWPAEPIPSNITAVGKDARVIGCSGHVYRGEVKLTQLAFDKMTTFKGVIRNHLVHQVCGYTIGDKHAATRADDLSDCVSYGILLGLGGPDGF